MIRNVSFNIRIGDDNVGKQEFEGRIVSFSDRINSILVPQSFMQWANDNYSNDEEQGTARVALKVVDESDPELAAYLKTEGYEIAGEQGNGSALKQFVDYTFLAILVISIVILGLTALVILVSFQVMVYRNKQAIELMMDLGYSIKSILLRYSKLLIVLSLLILAGAWLIFLPAYQVLSESLETKGLVTPGISAALLVAGSIGLLLILFVSNWISLRRQLTRIFWGG